MTVKTLLLKRNGPCGQQNRRKRGDIYGSHDIISMDVETLLGPCRRICIVGGQIYGNGGDHLRGFCTPNCWGWSDEIRSPITILRQKATRGTSLTHPDGEIYEIDALCPYRLVGCGGDVGRGRSELLGECGSAGYIRRPQASLLHMGPFQRGYGAVIRAGHRGQRSAKAAAGIEADRPSCGLRPKVPGAAVSASWDDK